MRCRLWARLKAGIIWQNLKCSLWEMFSVLQSSQTFFYFLPFSLALKETDTCRDQQLMGIRYLLDRGSLDCQYGGSFDSKISVRSVLYIVSDSKRYLNICCDLPLESLLISWGCTKDNLCALENLTQAPSCCLEHLLASMRGWWFFLEDERYFKPLFLCTVDKDLWPMFVKQCCWFHGNCICVFDSSCCC